MILGLCWGARRNRVYLTSASPKRVDSFLLQQRLCSREGVSSFLFGVMSNVLGNALKKHISCLVEFRIAEVLDGAPDVIKV